MTFNNPTTVFEIIPNLAWMYESKVIISLYGLRKGGHDNICDCDFAQAVELVRTIHSSWNITHWCFDWTAERDLFVYDVVEHEGKPIFDVLSKYLLEPIAKFINFDYAKMSFMHGDLNIKEIYQDWANTSHGHKFHNVDHVNRFFYHYNNNAYPCDRPHLLLRAAYTTFNRKHTPYRQKLFEYLNKNNLIDRGYVNFSFQKTSTLINELENEYETHMQHTENEIYKYYRASNFDIIMETTSTGDNRTFVTEKTMRALALGQPFVTYNGPNTLLHLQSLGFQTYGDFWDEDYDKINDPEKRFDAMISVAHSLIEDPRIFNNTQIEQVSKHNRYHFQKLAQLDHRQRWFNLYRD